MKVGIIGKGVVGSALYDGLQQLDHELCCFDPKINGSHITDVVNTDCVFVCVPTPTVDGRCDLSQINQVVALLNDYRYQGVVALKSTVLPGTTERLQNQYPFLKICFVPEFLREKSALTDFILFHDVLIVGTEDKDVYAMIEKIHGSLPKHIKQVSATEAEICKYYSNLFNALRIVFANGMFDVCDKLGADYQAVFDAITLRSTVGRDYLRSSKTLRQFGGACLPKDSLAWEAFVKDLGLDNKIFSAINEDNKKCT
jgi:UDPglucose 6-dehydrogenase